MTRTERTYYVVFSLYTVSAWFLAPMYSLFLLSRGLDLFQINVVLATYLISVFLFEVPTGAIADLAGRKVSFLLSCAVRMVAFTLYAFADDKVANRGGIVVGYYNSDATDAMTEIDVSGSTWSFGGSGSVSAAAQAETNSVGLNGGSGEDELSNEASLEVNGTAYAKTAGSTTHTPQRVKTRVSCCAAAS